MTPGGPRLTATVLDTPHPAVLAGFYRRLLGWAQRGEADETWVMLAAPDGGAGLSFQLEPDYVRPVWPSTPGEQQMSVHLDIGVEDLATAVTHALAVGAVLSVHQPQDDVRVLLDPDGHPFCLFEVTAA